MRGDFCYCNASVDAVVAFWEFRQNPKLELLVNKIYKFKKSNVRAELSGKNLPQGRIMGVGEL